MLFRKPDITNAIDKIEAEAKKVLSKKIYDHVAGGAGNESTVSHNRSAYSEIALVPRVLKNVRSVNLEIQILGVKVSSPIIIAPMSFHGLLSKEKEIGTAQAANEVGSIMTVSMMANTTLEEISSTVTSPLWFQLHIHSDHSITEQLVKRAEKSGYKAIVVTVDIPQKGARMRDVYNDFKMPGDCVPVNFVDPKTKKVNSGGVQFNPTATWEDVLWIKAITRLPIILKGILHHLDAEEAIRCGADGIIVSNHGGRQLESVVATIDVLPQIVKVVNGRIPVLIDGGIRSGVDVIKAIALGADAVLIGRPILWGLAVNGKEGVVDVLSSLNREIKLSMQLIGCRSIKEIKNRGSDLVFSISRKVANKDEHIKIENDLKQFAALQREQIGEMGKSISAASVPEGAAVVANKLRSKL